MADAVTDAAELAALAGRHLDLVTAPFTLPRSRVLVFRAEDGEGVRVHTSEYEKRLSACRVLDAVVVTDAAGQALPVTDVLPHRIAFGRIPGDASATLTFDGSGALSIAGVEGVRVTLTHPDGREEQHPLSGTGIRIRVAPDRSVTVEAGDHPAALAACEREWLDWFANCPRVRDDLQQMAAFCWWVLGANIVELPSLGDARAVVPSKIGYVGLWQWDAYFIAVGLRHGDPELAREQLEIAFRFPSSDGQLPDVVHEQGILATSDDLPESDRANLRRAGSQIADPSKPVPLTKPPLAAWALRGHDRLSRRARVLCLIAGVALVALLGINQAVKIIRGGRIRYLMPLWPLFAVIVARIVCGGPPRTLALITFATVLAALFGGELLDPIGVPGIWFPFNIGVSRTQYIYAISIPLLAVLIVRTLLPRDGQR